MKKNFANPEIKLSSLILFFIILFFLSLSLLLMQVQYSKLKDSYTKTIGAVANKVVEKNPAMESEIMPIITKGISQTEADKGKAFLNKYGLNPDTENVIFPYINNISSTFSIIVILIFILMYAVLFFANYFENSYFYNKIRIFTSAVKKIMEGNFDISISEEREGDISKLSNSFNSIKNIIQNNISELTSEKQFLVNLLSDISHQLKTPLSSLILYNDIMLSKDLSKEQTLTFLESSKKQLSKMKYLIMNLLKLAKLDAKSIELNKENQSLYDTIEDCVENFEYKASKAGIVINLMKNEDILFPHDRLWFEEAVSNIIKNCIEHTQSGGRIAINLIQNPVFTKITIEDNGEGIDENDLPNIFKRFYKAKSSKENSSIGIGLSLSKSIIELHGGTIEAYSKLSQGTQFIITFSNF